MYHCFGCKRMCRGLQTLCLDCEFAQEEMCENAYALGFNEGQEWGITHPHLIHFRVRRLPRLTRASPEKKTRGILPMTHEKTVQHAYERGYERGLRGAAHRIDLFKHVLDELLVDVGRRNALVYLTACIQRYPWRHQLDYNVLRVIDQML